MLYDDVRKRSGRDSLPSKSTWTRPKGSEGSGESEVHILVWGRVVCRPLTAPRRRKLEGASCEGQFDQITYEVYAATKPVAASTHGRDIDDEELEAMTAARKKKSELDDFLAINHA